MLGIAASRLQAGDQSLQHLVSEVGVAGEHSALGNRARRLTPKGLIGSIERRILLAGVEDQWPLERVLAAKLMLGLCPLVLGTLFLLASPSGGTFLIVLGVTVGSYFIPDYVLAGRSSKRRVEIENTLADTLDQITITVEAGLGFEAAVDRVVRSGDGVLKAELSRMLSDIQLGVPRAQAIDALISRTNVRDLKNFLRAVSQAERYGIPIAQILRVQAGELRDKRRQKAEEQAAKVGVKMTMPIILCILPALFIVVLAPTIINGV
jgi:tight adherence protein C